MGIDKSLSDQYPSVIIKGKQYHYGKTPEYDSYLVENASYAKDYWSFREEADLRAFLINLPESADRQARIRAAYPDWKEVSYEEQGAYLAEDRAAQRALADEKVRNGTAPTYNMDLEGRNGPYEPQQIQKAASSEPPLLRAERQLADYKRLHAPPDNSPESPGGQLGNVIERLMDHSFGSGLSEAGKLAVLESQIDWSGVSDADKSAVLSREVNFSKITPEQFRFVYQHVNEDRYEPVRPPETLLGELINAQRQGPATGETQPEAPGSAKALQIRDTTRNLFEAVWLDTWPRAGAIVDFGIDSQEHYEALYYGIREGEITPEALDAALGHGEKLTALARSSPSNPHREIIFSTSWDVVLGRTNSGEPWSESDTDFDEDMPLVGNKAEALYAEWREDSAARARETAGPESWQVWHQLGYPESRIAEIVGISEPVFPHDFMLVATVPATSPNEALQLTTDTGDILDGSLLSWERNPAVVAHVAIPRSTDAGDVVVDPKGYAYRVEPDGFRRIGEPALSPSDIAERTSQVESGDNKNYDRNRDR